MLLRKYSVQCDKLGCAANVGTITSEVGDAQESANRVRALATTHGWTRRAIFTGPLSVRHADLCPEHSDETEL